MIHRLTQILVFLTLLLLLAGGLVTSTDSGLAVPDWPLSYGSLMPPLVGGIRFEHTHRVLAASVGFLMLVLTLWIGRTERSKAIRWLAISAFGAVVLQGILGGLTVLHRLPAPISMAHACLGPIFFSLVVSLAEVTGPEGRRVGPAPVPYLSIIPLVFLQILLGAVVRHTGRWIWVHILWAFVVLAGTGVLVRHSFTKFGVNPGVLRLALLLGILVVAEFFLGVGAFVFTQIEGIPAGLGRVIFPTLHQTLGAAILATSVLIGLRPARAREGAFA